MKHEAINRQDVIDADRFVLRALSPSDAGLIEAATGDARVAHMTPAIPFPLPEGAAEEFILQSLAADRVEDVWAIDGRLSGMPPVLGLVSLRDMGREQSEIGYWVAPSFWGQGVAREAVSALLTVNPHANRSVFGSVFQDNPASARVLEASGFQYLGEAEAFSLSRAAHVPTWNYLKSMQ